MKNGYHLNLSLFQCRTRYLNDNLNYTPSDHKSVNLLGTVARVTSKNTHKINLSFPVDDSGARVGDREVALVGWLFHFLLARVVSGVRM